MSYESLDIIYCLFVHFFLKLKSRANVLLSTHTIINCSTNTTTDKLQQNNIIIWFLLVLLTLFG